MELKNTSVIKIEMSMTVQEAKELKKVIEVGISEIECDLDEDEEFDIKVARQFSSALKV